jgi:lysozyme
MKLSHKSIEALKGWESFAGEPYNDEAGNATIGYGDLMHKGPVTEAEKSIRISVQEAEGRLIKKLRPFEDGVAASVRVPLSQNQFDALVNWTYNCGLGALRECSWLKEINKGNYAAVPELMRRWNKIRDPRSQLMVVSRGLVNRRQWEANLFEGKIA